MTLVDFIKQREVLLFKVCYRKYVCKNTIKMIVVNIVNNTTAILEDVSALFFECLASKRMDEIESFSECNELSRKDIEEFIYSLIQTGIIGREEPICDCRIDNNEEDRGLQSSFKELYENGYLINAHIDITLKCNLRCKHCYHPFEQYENRTELSFADIKKFIDDIYEMGVFFVTLSGGEIFVRRDLKNIIEYITSKGMVVNLLTNAMLIDDGDIAMIKNNNVQKIGISLYSIDEDVHDKITGVQGSCEKTKNAIQKLKDIGIAININCVLMEENYRQYKVVHKYCQDNKLSLTLDISMTPKLDGDRTPIDLCLSYEHMVQFMLDEDYNYYIDNNKEIDWDSESCQAGRGSIYCSPEGEIYPCVSFRLKLGSMKDIKNIWNTSEKLLAWQKVSVKDFRGCGEKEYCKFCLEVCAGISMLETQDYLCGESSNCIKAKARCEAYKRLYM